MAMLSVEQALERVLGLARKLTTEEVSIEDALGRATSRPVDAVRALPPWDNSAMDGYAVRGAELAAGVSLTIVEEIFAGHAPARAIGPGECARIMTGAVMPQGADTVVMQEKTKPSSDRQVQIVEVPEAGDNVRRRGEDVREGSVLLGEGTPVGLAEAGLLWAQGLTRVWVHGRPSVAIATSGDELRAVGEESPLPDAGRGSGRGEDRGERAPRASWISRLASVRSLAGPVTESRLTDFLSKQYGVPAIDLDAFTIDPAIIKLVSKDVALKHLVVPVNRAGAVLIVAMADPSNVYAADDLSFLTGCRVEPVVASEQAIRAAIDKHYAAPSQSSGIIDTNSPVLAAAVRRAGGVPTQLGIAPDRLDALVATLGLGLKHDVLVSIAGASVGERDFTRDAFAKLGVEIDFWNVAMRPGKPLAVGQCTRAGRHTLVFALPGNPVSAMVTFELFVRPALRAMQGLPPQPLAIPARAAVAISKSAGLRHFVRATVHVRDGALWAAPLSTQSSGALSSAVGATHLISLPPQSPGVSAGDEIALIPLTWA